MSVQKVLKKTQICNVGIRVCKYTRVKQVAILTCSKKCSLLWYSKASPLIPDSKISLYGSSFNSLFFYLILALLPSFVGIPKAGWNVKK